MCSLATTCVLLLTVKREPRDAVRLCSLSTQCVLLQNYRMCSLATECVLLLQNVFSYRMCSLIECVLV
jgi:hypothetical protein